MAYAQVTICPTNKITNGTFDSNANGWTFNPNNGWQYAGGASDDIWVNDSGTNLAVFSTNSLCQNQRKQVKFNIYHAFNGSGVFRALLGGQEVFRLDMTTGYTGNFTSSSNVTTILNGTSYAPGISGTIPTISDQSLTLDVLQYSGTSNDFTLEFVKYSGTRWVRIDNVEVYEVIPEKPDNPTSTSLAYCAATTVDLTSVEPTSVSGATYEWYTQNANPPSATAKVADPTAVTAGTYYLYLRSDCDGVCLSQAAAQSVTVTEKPLPPCSISGNSGPLCPRRSYNYNGPANMESYTWSISGGATITNGANARRVRINTQATTGTNTFTLTLVTEGTNGCTSTCSRTITIEDNTDPILPTLNDITAICGANVPTPFAFDACRNAYIRGTTSDATTFNAAGSYTINWRFNDGNGNIVNATQNVTINDLPTTTQTLTDWRCGCDNRRRITIDNTAGSALSNYQIRINVPYDAKMNADFSDLRFTDSDETTDIPYWIETYQASFSAVVWVKVPSIPANDTKDIYVYYNGCGDTTTGNPANVFEFFEDMNSLTGWTNINANQTNLSATTYDGASVLLKQNQCDPRGGWKPLGFTINDFRLITREQRPIAGPSGCGLNRYGLENSSFNGYGIMRNGVATGNGSFGFERRTNGGGGDANQRSLAEPIGNWYRTELLRCSSSDINEAHLYNDDRTYVGGVTGRTLTENYSGFDRVTIRGGRNYYVDFMAVAKYTCNEPTACVGDELEHKVSATLSGTTTICEGETATLTVTLSGTATWSLTYTDGSNQTTVGNINTSTYNITVSPTTTTTYTLVAVQDKYCTGTVTGTATVTVNPLPNKDKTGFKGGNICKGEQGVITFNGINSGSYPYTITYINNTNASNVYTQTITSSSAQTFNAQDLSISSEAGTYNYTLLSITDANGCILSEDASVPNASSVFNGGKTARIAIRENPADVVDMTVTTNTACAGEIAPVITFTNSDTKKIVVTYKKNGGADQIIEVDGGSSATVNVPTNAAGIYTYQATNVKYKSNPNCETNINLSECIAVFPSNNTVPIVNSGAGIPIVVTSPTTVTGFNIEYSFDNGVNWVTNTPPTTDNCEGYKIKTRYVLANACGNITTGIIPDCAISPATIRVVDTTAPTFDVPATVLSVCVNNIKEAIYNPVNKDITPKRPDYYEVAINSTELDINNLADNCCNVNDLEISWNINGTSYSGTGQPSTYGSIIKLELGTNKYASKTYTITYTVKDCNNNTNSEKTRNIIIKPRPKIE